MPPKPRTPVQAELSWEQVHGFRLRRHHLQERAPGRDLARVVGEIGGAQAQLMSAAELQIAVRVDCTVGDVRQALWHDRTLVKTWLMRGTLHLARSEDLPLYSAAMSGPWVRARPSWLKFMDMTEAEFWKIEEEIGAALDGRPLTREELIARVGKGKSPRIHELLRSGWGGILKPAARSGLLCFGPSRGQSVTFVNPRDWLGGWRVLDPSKAIVEAGRRYLRAYGPATRTDFARWWGAWPGVANAAWSGLATEIATVSVEGARLDILHSDLDELTKARVEERVQLLPAFDPYILGHASRNHLVEKSFAPKVSRTAGWISAVVLVDGRVVGTWTQTLANKTLRVEVEAFRRLGSATVAEVKQRAGEVMTALGATKVRVKVA